MWKRRWEKKEGGKEKGGVSAVGERVEKVRGRLGRLNEGLVGLV